MFPKKQKKITSVFVRDFVKSSLLQQQQNKKKHLSLKKKELNPNFSIDTTI
jgi:hypothetical protein